MQPRLVALSQARGAGPAIGSGLPEDRVAAQAVLLPLCEASAAKGPQHPSARVLAMGADPLSSPGVGPLMQPPMFARDAARLGRRLCLVGFGPAHPINLVNGVPKNWLEVSVFGSR